MPISSPEDRHRPHLLEACKQIDLVDHDRIARQRRPKLHRSKLCCFKMRRLRLRCIRRGVRLGRSLGGDRIRILIQLGEIVRRRLVGHRGKARENFLGDDLLGGRLFCDGFRLGRRGLFRGGLRLRRFGLGGFGWSGRNFRRGLFCHCFDGRSGRVGCGIRRFGDR